MSVFNQRRPALLVVDNFLREPTEVRNFALSNEFRDGKGYKGKRTMGRHLWPGLQDEFERLLGANITDWVHQPMNGRFQLTGYADPLVYHCDMQQYAGAIYLTPDAPLNSGTSFWRCRATGCRRPPGHPLERDRFADQAKIHETLGQMFSPGSVLSPDTWELCDRVGAVFNRLVLWDGRLVHSASDYSGLDSDDPEKGRLVQLFFFNVVGL